MPVNVINNESRAQLILQLSEKGYQLSSGKMMKEQGPNDDIALNTPEPGR